MMKKLLLGSTALCMAIGGAHTIAVAQDNDTALGAYPTSAFRDTDFIAPQISYSDGMVAEMLEIWNRRGDVDGMKCAECHSSPNAAEFKFVGVDEDDIMRRGILHHSEEEIRTLIAGNDKLVELLNLPEDADRDSKFVMQPGGAPTDGEHYWERDYNFLKDVVSEVTPKMLGDINTFKDAQEAYEQFIDNTKNPMKVQFPFVSPVYSGDKHHHDNTGTIHKWVTVLPIQPTSAANEEIIRQRREAYLAEPNNANFWNWYRAVDLGSGPLGFRVKDFGSESNTTGKRTAAVDAHPLASQTNAAAAKYEMEKYLIGMIAWHNDQQVAFRDAGLLPKDFLTFLEDPNNLFRPGFQKAYNARLAEKENVYLGVGDASGQPIGKNRLKYPTSIIEAFLGDEFVDTSRFLGSSERTEAIVSDHAYIGSVDWWAMTHIFAWRDVFHTAAYWIGDMTQYGTQYTIDLDREGVTRETAKPGYPGFNLWATMRAAVIEHDFNYQRALERAEKSRFVDIEDHYDRLSFRILPYRAMMVADAIANDEHRALIKKLAVNTRKMTMLYQIENNKRFALNGRGLKNTLTKGGASEGNQIYREAFQVNWLAEWVAEDMPEVAQELLDLQLESEYWRAQVYGSYGDPNPAEGNGDGVIFTAFDDQNFKTPLVTMALPDIHLASTNEERAYDFQGAVPQKIEAMNPYNYPIPHGDQPGMSARWEGYLLAPYTDRYDITVYEDGWRADMKSVDEYKVWVDDKLVYHKVPGSRVDGYPNNRVEELHVGMGERDPSWFINLEKGQRYKVVVEMSSPNPKAGKGILQWASENYQPLDFVRPEFLYTTATSEASDSDTHPEVMQNGNIPTRYSDYNREYFPEGVSLEVFEGVPFEHQFEATGGEGEITWYAGGQMPYGMTLSKDGVLSGTPERRPQSETRSPGKRRTFHFAAIAVDGDGDGDVLFVDYQIAQGGQTPPASDDNNDSGNDNGGSDYTPPVDNTPPADVTPPADATRIELESFTLSGDYRVENKGPASGGSLVTLHVPNGPQVAGASGTATTTFQGEAGVYDLTLGYFDENDGVASATLEVNGEVIEQVVFNGDLGHGAVAARNRATETMEGVTLKSGDVISITGMREANEYARVDYLDFVKTDAAVDAPAPVDTPDPVEEEPVDDAPVLGETLDSVSLGGFLGTVSKNGDTYTLTGGGSSMRNRSRSDNLMFVPLATDLSTSGTIVVNADIDLSENSGAYLAVRQSTEQGVRTFMVGRENNTARGRDGARRDWRRRADGKHVSDTGGKGSVRLRIINGKVGGVKFDEGFTIGLVATSVDGNDDVTATFSGVTVETQD